MVVELTRVDEFALITLNRPEAMNALSFQIIRDIGMAIDEALSTDARALLFTGAGDKAFCAGADIKELRNRSLADAQKAVADVTARILDLTRELGIDPKLVNATGAMVTPNYRWNRSTEEQELVNYIAERRIQIEVRDLDRLGALVEGAVGAGANQVSPPVLDSTRRREAYREALANAAADARRNADVLANTLGVKLGRALRVDAVDAQSPVGPMIRAAQAAPALAEAAPATYAVGDIRFDATVLVAFAVLDE